MNGPFQLGHRLGVHNERERIREGLDEALDRYAYDLAFTAPELHPVRLSELRSAVTDLLYEAGQGTGKSGTARSGDGPARGSESAEAQNRPPAASTHIVYCLGCGEAWTDPGGAGLEPDEGPCACVCTDPESERWVAMTAERFARAGVPAVPDAEHTVVDAADWGQLLAVATLYVDAFADDERMTLPERMSLQVIEDILAKYGRRY